MMMFIQLESQNQFIWLFALRTKLEFLAATRQLLHTNIAGRFFPHS